MFLAGMRPTSRGAALWSATDCCMWSLWAEGRPAWRWPESWQVSRLVCQWRFVCLPDGSAAALHLLIGSCTAAGSAPTLSRCLLGGLAKPPLNFCTCCLADFVDRDLRKIEPDKFSTSHPFLKAILNQLLCRLCGPGAVQDRPRQRCLYKPHISQSNS